MYRHCNERFEYLFCPSIGVYIIKDRDEYIGNIINKARTAHETIKHNNRSQIAYYDENICNIQYEDRQLEKEMRHALKNHEFVPYIQPKYHAESCKICGGEALIRWIRPDDNMIFPGKFIPLAENDGFIRKLDREMFYMVCQFLKDLMDKEMEAVPISVNVSRHLMYKKNFAEDYYRIVKEMGISTDLVELEITESAFFENQDLFTNVIEKLHSYGFRILMDDFGTGYSSLMMLKSIPIDLLKLDKSFIDDYDGEKGKYIIDCILSLAKNLGLSVVAEGVETENQYLYLKEKGCEVIQGFYFSKPITLNEFMDKLINSSV